MARYNQLINQECEFLNSLTELLKVGYKEYQKKSLTNKSNEQEAINWQNPNNFNKNKNPVNDVDVPFLSHELTN